MSKDNSNQELLQVDMMFSDINESVDKERINSRINDMIQSYSKLINQTIEDFPSDKSINTIMTATFGIRILNMLPFLIGLSNADENYANMFRDEMLNMIKSDFDSCYLRGLNAAKDSESVN